jgi:hypothetical protein
MMGQTDEGAEPVAAMDDGVADEENGSVAASYYSHTTRPFGPGRGEEGEDRNSSASIQKKTSRQGQQVQQGQRVSTGTGYRTRSSANQKVKLVEQVSQEISDQYINTRHI